MLARMTIAALAALLPAAAGRAEEKPRLNVLFIAVDDLRPELGCYGAPHAKSPNIDRLAKRGLLFTHAYCQQAVCSPSRTSLLLGRRPDTTKVYDLQTHFRKNLPDVVTLPEHFKKHGYHTQAFGKIFHGGLDDEQSWSAKTSGAKSPRFGPEGQKLLLRLRDEAKKAGQDASRVRGLPWEAPDVEDGALADGSIAGQALETLEAIKDRPFFLAVGFLNPHLPFAAPKRYWDLYDATQFELPSVKRPPEGAPAYAPTNWGELRQYHGIPKQGPLTDEQTRSMIHGYHAALSYTDAQVGRLLDALDRLKLTDRTVVVLWGDHGWHLGDHGQWCKHTNYERAVHVPMLFSAPGMKSAGRKTDALAEFVDIYPSLVEACGLPMPEGLEGTSFVPLLDDPARPWKKVAFSQYPRQIPGQGRGMGYTLRTERYRLVEWRVPGKDFREYELYDYEKDPGETVNLATKPEFAPLVKELAGRLEGGWKSAAPAGR